MELKCLILHFSRILGRHGQTCLNRSFLLPLCKFGRRPFTVSTRLHLVKRFQRSMLMDDLGRLLVGAYKS